MKLTFFGATQTVTGSKYLVEEGNARILVDCGLFQGFRELRQRNWDPLPIHPKTIQAVLLTHAHIDHSGYLPLLVKEGFKGPIYCTKGTQDLCEILLRDSGRLQEEDARRANRYGYTRHKPALPLYTEDDAKAALKYFQPIDFRQNQSLSNGLHFNFTHSGHILGSAFITLQNNETTVVVSGDVGRPNDPIMHHPFQIKSTDYLLLESTYGNRLHPKVDVLDELAEIINSTIAKGGSVIIPSFAVGRSQSILYYINKLKSEKRIPANIPVYLDSPMAQDATDLWCRFDGEHSLPDQEVASVCSLASYVQTTEDSKRLNSSPYPSIIISASGMAEGGRILHHIAHYAPHAENTILFAGFQAGGTRGDRMVRGEREIKIHGQMVPVRARVENLSALSSHADYEELLQWLKGFEKAPKETFLTHGEPDAAEAFKAKIEAELGWKVTIPQYLQTVTLDER